MGKIVISTNISLDGVVQDPDGREGFRLGGWFCEFGGEDLEAWAKMLFAEAQRTRALLLGRRSDAWFAERWLSRDDPWADRLNALPKYVVSSQEPRWSNATLVTVDELPGLKRDLDGDLVVYASCQLARWLLEHGLVDELRLFVFPVALGDGERLFGETTTTPMRLVGARVIGEGLLFVTYETSCGPSWPGSATQQSFKDTASASSRG